MKLNLGCGNQKIAGAINVDRDLFFQPDQRLDLEDTPWPWPDQVIDEVIANHILEHMNNFLPIMQELYRIMKPGALLYIKVPHPRSDNFLADPTHIRPILPMTMRMFSRRLNTQTLAESGATTPLALMLNIDFELESEEYGYSLWGASLPSHILDKARETQFNICTEIGMVMRRI